MRQLAVVKRSTNDLIVQVWHEKPTNIKFLLVFILMEEIMFAVTNMLHDTHTKPIFKIYTGHI
jgi:hypothetical protein